MSRGKRGGFALGTHDVIQSRIRFKIKAGIRARMLPNFRVYEWRFERFNYAVTERKKIFGTDGVRGVANVEPVTAETALKLGRAAAYVFAQMNPRRTPDGARPKIENLVFSGEIDSIRPTANNIGRATRIDDALGRYVEFAKASFPRGMSLDEMRVAVDVANGAAYKSTPCVLRELGAEVALANNEPNGININDVCGSMHPEEIQRVRSEERRVGKECRGRWERGS